MVGRARLPIASSTAGAARRACGDGDSRDRTGRSSSSPRRSTCGRGRRAARRPGSSPRRRSSLCDRRPHRESGSSRSVRACRWRVLRPVGEAVEQRVQGSDPGEVCGPEYLCSPGSSAGSAAAAISANRSSVEPAARPVSHQRSRACALPEVARPAFERVVPAVAVSVVEALIGDHSFGRPRASSAIVANDGSADQRRATGAISACR